MTKIRALVADDESAARDRIIMLLDGDSAIEVVGECSDGRATIAAIRKLSPDLLFLDIQMPEFDGFEVLRKISVERMPVVIFVTAYDKYALNAFDANAVDYLLKPFNRQRFNRALKRARAQVALGRVSGVEERLSSLLRDLRPQKRYLERLVVKSGGYVFFLKVDEIDWIEAADNYARLHVRKVGYLVRETMNGLETALDPNEFIRIQRSVIVNIQRIKRMHLLSRGEYTVILTDGTQLTSSRGYRAKLATLFGKPF
ncbi:MAG TPA: LytTR family DNA-binding domain-containing protein [Pyrinomonadaceae bacterium]|nr:LytTR family DNA-binding domain-containing protein [Pyrinomonadaceae bacterium]